MILYCILLSHCMTGAQVLHIVLASPSLIHLSFIPSSSVKQQIKSDNPEQVLTQNGMC